MLSISGLLALVALAFLTVHLLTDARRMVQVLQRRHAHQTVKQPCGITCSSRRPQIEAGIKEAWWEVATFVALIGHITLDYVG